ncbi:MAG: SufD family Fe-S cluster assembly protein [Candidatus Woesearchaeota archaeon]
MKNKHNITINEINKLKSFEKLDWPNPKEDTWKYIKIDYELFNSVFNNIKKDEIKINRELKNISVIDNNQAEIKTIKNKNNEKNYQHDKIDALNSEFYNNGLVIEIKNNENEILETNYISENSGLYNTKNIIIVNENADFNYIQTNKIKQKIFRTEFNEIYLKENSKMNYYLLVDTSEESQDIININVYLEKNSFFNIITAQKKGKLNRIKINVYHNTGNSESRIYSCFLGNNNDVIDITTNTIHDSENTKSDILVKGVLNQKSQSVYRGKIKITEKGNKTISFLSDHSLLLGENSYSYSIPSLEIDTNDVKASHSASTGKIEKELLFYLMSRGINKQEAEKLITKGFLFDIFNKISDENIKKIFIEFFEDE